MQHLIFIVTVLFFINCNTPAGSNQGPGVDTDIQSKVLVNNLNNPWEITWGPDGFIWMTEKGGRISRVNPATGKVIPLHTENAVVSRGEGGLLGMALHPDFTNHPNVFVSYNYEQAGNYKQRVVRYTYNGATLTDPVILLDQINASGNHNGSRVAVSPDLKLFITTGDSYNTALPQQNASLNGKILRINLDGTIPADNPITGSPLWTKGHRNPQGLVFANGIMYSSEHGPSNDDEVNIIEKGRNYGWPDVEGFCDGSEIAFCKANQVKEPVKAWTPTLAVSGLDYYDNKLIAAWKNSLLLCTLKASRLLQLQLDASHTQITATHEYLINAYGRLRDVCISPQGKVYVCTGNGSEDKIVEITAK